MPAGVPEVLARSDGVAGVERDPGQVDMRDVEEGGDEGWDFEIKDEELLPGTD